jgi:hypothetical protein
MQNTVLQKVSHVFGRHKQWRWASAHFENDSKAGTGDRCAAAVDAATEAAFFLEKTSSLSAEDSKAKIKLLQADSEHKIETLISTGISTSNKIAVMKKTPGHVKVRRKGGASGCPDTQVTSGVPLNHSPAITSTSNLWSNRAGTVRQHGKKGRLGRSCEEISCGDGNVSHGCVADLNDDLKRLQSPQDTPNAVSAADCEAGSPNHPNFPISQHHLGEGSRIHSAFWLHRLTHYILCLPTPIWPSDLRLSPGSPRITAIPAAVSSSGLLYPEKNVVDSHPGTLLVAQPFKGRCPPVWQRATYRNNSPDSRQDCMPPPHTHTPRPTHPIYISSGQPVH